MVHDPSQSKKSDRPPLKFEGTLLNQTVKFHPSLNFALDAIIVLFVGWSVSAMMFKHLTLVEFALTKTNDYFPVTWVLGLTLGMGIAHWINRERQNKRRLEKLKNWVSGLETVEKEAWWKWTAIGVFILALAAAVLEFVWIGWFDKTLSREIFNYAQTSPGLYFDAGMLTGILVVVALLAANLNVWFRLSIIIVVMVSAHIFWHLSPDAYIAAKETKQEMAAASDPD